MPNRSHRETDFDQRLFQFLRTVGRDCVLHAILLAADARRSERLLEVIEQATAPMFEHIRDQKRGLVSVQRAWAFARRAFRLTLPVLSEIGIELPPRQRAELQRDYEQLFAFLRRTAMNRDGSGDLAALSLRSDEAQAPESAWLALEYRLAYIEERLRRGQDFSPERFVEVFGLSYRSGPLRGQRLSDADITRLLGLTAEGFGSLKSIRPSPAALNELHRHTGYVDRSLRARATPKVAPMAAHTRGAAGVSESDIDKLDLEADFEVLVRKFKRLKSRRSQ